MAEWTRLRQGVRLLGQTFSRTPPASIRLSRGTMFGADCLSDNNHFVKELRR